jgi:hypothetical protein
MAVRNKGLLKTEGPGSEIGRREPRESGIRGGITAEEDVAVFRNFGRPGVLCRTVAHRKGSGTAGREVAVHGTAKTGSGVVRVWLRSGTSGGTGIRREGCGCA